jgi:hypothetical protein
MRRNRLVVVVILLVAAYLFIQPFHNFVGGLFRASPAQAVPGSDTGAVASPGAPPEAVPATACVTPELVPYETSYLGIVIDSTTSTDASFSEGVREALAAKLAGYVPAKPEQLAAASGVAPTNALHAVIQLVGDAPFAYGSTTQISIDIPGVPGLPERPQLDCIESGEYQRWSALAKSWGADWDAATAAGQAAATDVRNIDLVVADSVMSGIRAAVSKVAVAVPQGEHAGFLLASDMDENSGVQQAGSLGGHTVILINACPTGDADKCSADLNRVATWAVDALGAGAALSYPAEQTTLAIDALFAETAK